MQDFVSMQSKKGEVVDCRRLQIEFSFDNTTQIQLRKLAKFCVDGIKELLDNSFYLEWSFLGKRVKETTLIERLDCSTGMCDFDFIGNSLISGINNHKSMIAFNKQIIRQLNSASQVDDVSVDFEDYFSAIFRNTTTLDDIKKGIIELFNIEDRQFMQHWIGADVTGHLFTCPYRAKKDLYFGHFDFRIALQCLSDNACAFANKSAAFLKALTAITPDINGRVALSPSYPPSSCSSYMDYFGGWIRHCPINKPSYMQEHEWIHACFIKGVEWFNLISPLQAERLSKIITSQYVVVETLPTGGCVVSLNKSILQVQTSDLRVLKVFLYPILYPGGIEIPIKDLLRIKLRTKWENVPVLENEVIITNGVLVMQYQTDWMNSLTKRK